MSKTARIDAKQFGILTAVIQRRRSKVWAKTITPINWTNPFDMHNFGDPEIYDAMQILNKGPSDVSATNQYFRGPKQCYWPLEVR